jgi:hypothetical protein
MTFHKPTINKKFIIKVLLPGLDWEMVWDGFCCVRGIAADLVKF